MPVSRRGIDTHASGPMRSMALINPKAGTFDAQEEFLPLVEQAKGIVRLLSSSNDLAVALGEAEQNDIERLIIVGGDGSVSSTVNALRSNLARFELAVVPAGTGNDLARSLGIPVDDLAMAWHMALQGVATPIDLIQLLPTGKLFVNGITAGFGGHEASPVDRDQKSSWGKLAYWLTALLKMGEMQDFRLALHAPELTQELTSYGFWIANGRYVGGGFTVAPTAMLNDGLLDVVAIPSGGALDLLSAGVDYAVIGPEKSEQIFTFRTKSIQISTNPHIALSIDGEPHEAQELECVVLPAAVSIVTGNVEPALLATSENASLDNDGTVVGIAP